MTTLRVILDLISIALLLIIIYLLFQRYRFIAKTLKVKVINRSLRNRLPEYETVDSSGLDLRSNENIVIAPNETRLVKTGLYVDIPKGYEAQVRPRSGLALKNNITIANTPGTIDADYRGEIGVVLRNEGSNSFTVTIGDRIAQMVFVPVVKIVFVNKEKLSTTDRGAGGFGHTGKQ